MSLLESSTLLRATDESDESLAARQSAQEKLGEFAMPTGREEVWRYVDLDFDLAEFELAAIPDDGLAAASQEGAAGTATVIDGVVLAAQASDPSVQVNRAVGSFDSLIAADQDIFTAAHAAYAAERVEIVVAAGKAIADPVFVDVSAISAKASFSAVSISVGDGAEATVAIRLRSEDGLAALVVPHLEGSLGANSNLTVVVDQGWGTATRSIGQIAFEVGRDSSLKTAEAGLGGSLARWQLDIKLATFLISLLVTWVVSATDADQSNTSSETSSK